MTIWDAIRLAESAAEYPRAFEGWPSSEAEIEADVVLRNYAAEHDIPVGRDIRISDVNEIMAHAVAKSGQGARSKALRLAGGALEAARGESVGRVYQLADYAKRCMNVAMFPEAGAFLLPKLEQEGINLRIAPAPQAPSLERLQSVLEIVAEHLVAAGRPEITKRVEVWATLVEDGPVRGPLPFTAKAKMRRTGKIVTVVVGRGAKAGETGVLHHIRGRMPNFTERKGSR